jgi:hypothetical protein
MYKTVIFPVLLYERENFYLILREEHKLRVFLEDRMKRKVFGSTIEGKTEELINLRTGSFMICTLDEILCY